MSTLRETLVRKRRAAAVVLWTERVFAALSPAIGILVAYVWICLIGVTGSLPPLLDLLTLAFCLLSSTVIGWTRLRAVRAPSIPEIDRRLEGSRGAVHRPLATLADRPAWGGADRVWQAHRERALAQIHTLRPGLPSIGPAALAGSAAVLGVLLLSLMLAGPSGALRLRNALMPFGNGSAVAPARVQAWIVPPGSTGSAPVFLNAQGGASLPIQIGSHLVVSVVGGSRAPTLILAEQTHKFRRLSATSFQAELALRSPGRLAVWRYLHRIAAWDLKVVADLPPVIRLSGVPRIVDTRLMIPWDARDDFGLAKIDAVFILRGQSGVDPFSINLPIEGRPRTVHGDRLPDLTAQPWAGLPAVMHLVATDIAGQRSLTEDVAVDLPERSFLNAIARALIGMRRRLVTEPDAATRVAAALDGISTQAAGQIAIGQWLNLRAVATLLQIWPQRLGEAEGRLWQLALAIEDGGLTDARQRLAQARDRLREALAAQPSATQQARVAMLTQALDAAIQAFLQALDQQAAPTGAMERSDGRSIDGRQVQQMARDVAEAAKAGRLADAAKRLQQLSALLENLRHAQPRPGEAEPGRPADAALERLLRDQASLRERTERRLTNAGGQAALEEGDDHPPPVGAPGAGRQSGERRQRQDEAAAQAVLRHALGELASRIGTTGQPVPGGFARADGAMQEAAQALSNGDDSTARAAQQRASDGLRSGERELTAEPGNGRGGTAEQSSGQDPFGRSSGANVQEDAPSLQLGGDAALSRTLRDELRRRAADRLRQQQELNYLDRLLKTE